MLHFLVHFTFSPSGSVKSEPSFLTLPSFFSLSPQVKLDRFEMQKMSTWLDVQGCAMSSVMLLGGYTTTEHSRRPYETGTCLWWMECSIYIIQFIWFLSRGLLTAMLTGTRTLWRVSLTWKPVGDIKPPPSLCRKRSQKFKCGNLSWKLMFVRVNFRKFNWCTNYGQRNKSYKILGGPLEYLSNSVLWCIV